MKLLYTHENRYLVHNIQNIIENSGIDIMLKNEFAAGAAGDLVPHETWLELWIMNDADYEQASQVLSDSFSLDTDASWNCTKCTEINDASFDYCWNCQHEHIEA
jgi:hypothetical protein